MYFGSKVRTKRERNKQGNIFQNYLQWHRSSRKESEKFK